MRNHTIFALAACLSLAGAACKQANRSSQKDQQAQQQAAQQPQPSAQAPQQGAQAPQAQAPQQGAQAPQQGQQSSASGSVNQVGSNDITVGQTGGQTMHIFVDSNVPVTVDGQTVSLRDVPVGAQAIVVFTTQGDQQKAQRIDATTRQPVRGTEEPQPKNQPQPNDQPQPKNQPQPNDQRPMDHEQP